MGEALWLSPDTHRASSEPGPFSRIPVPTTHTNGPLDPRPTLAVLAPSTREAGHNNIHLSCATFLAGQLSPAPCKIIQYLLSAPTTKRHPFVNLTHPLTNLTRTLGFLGWDPLPHSLICTMHSTFTPNTPGPVTCSHS